MKKFSLFWCKTGAYWRSGRVWSWLLPKIESLLRLGWTAPYNGNWRRHKLLLLFKGCCWRRWLLLLLFLTLLLIWLVLAVTWRVEGEKSGVWVPRRVPRVTVLLVVPWRFLLRFVWLRVFHTPVSIQEANFERRLLLIRVNWDLQKNRICKVKNEVAPV